MKLAERPFKMITPEMEVAPPRKLLVSVYTVASMPIAYIYCFMETLLKHCRVI